MEADPVETKDVLDAEEAAELLGMTSWTVRDQAEKGHLPGRKVDRTWRFSRKALLDWVRGEGNGGEGGERLSPDDLAAVREGIAALRRGEFVTLDEYERQQRQ